MNCQAPTTKDGNIAVRDFALLAQRVGKGDRLRERDRQHPTAAKKESPVPPWKRLLHRGFGHWSFVIGHSLVIGHWSLVIGHWSFFTGHWSLLTAPRPC